MKDCKGIVYKLANSAQFVIIMWQEFTAVLLCFTSVITGIFAVLLDAYLNISEKSKSGFKSKNQKLRILFPTMLFKL